MIMQMVAKKDVSDEAEFGCRIRPMRMQMGT